MRVVFMGTPAAAVPSLRALASRHDVAAVYTRPDRPKGRGRHVAPSEVKVAATELALDVVQPKTLRRDDARQQLAAMRPDAIAVAAYGLLLPPPVLALPRLGCVNVHFSLLPRWRGAAPVERAIEAGDGQAGVTTMLMDEGLDTGPILQQRAEPIRPDDTTQTLTARLAEIGAGLLIETLAALESGRIEPMPQSAEGVTMAPKIDPSETRLDLSAPAEVLARRIRAFGGWTLFRGKRLKVLAASAEGGSGEPGTLVEPGAVATGTGRLRLIQVQPEGKRVMAADDFVRGYRPRAGERLGASPPTP